MKINLSPFYVGSYSFSARFLDDAFLPEYKGSTFRGVLGHALKKVVCALRRQDCGDCLLKSRCLYPFVFEAKTAVETAPHGNDGPPGGQEMPADPLGRRRLAVRPHPYILEPLSGNKTRYRSGEAFEFNLILCGETNDSLPYFIYAFNEVGKTGIGRKQEGQRARFSILSVSAQNQTLYDGNAQRMFPGDVTEDLAVMLNPLLQNSQAPGGESDDEADDPLAAIQAAPAAVRATAVAIQAGGAPERTSGEPEQTSGTAVWTAAAPAWTPAAADRPSPPAADRPSPPAGTSPGRLALTLQTPLRLKYENHLRASLPFHVLIRAALRRISSLCLYYGGGEPDLDYRGLTDRAQDVQSDESDLHWFDWERYSSRQDQRMLMGGMIGQVRYEGDLAEFLPLLRFCEKVHIGKQTTFGLGRIKIENIF